LGWGSHGVFVVLVGCSAPGGTARG
jgi:hypothetical protein